MRWRAWWVGAAALACVTTGCGDDGDEPSPSEADVADCPYVTADDLGAAFDSGFEEVDGNAGTCTFRGDDGLGIQVTRVEVVDAELSYPAEARQRCDEGTLVEVDAGDQAFACTDLEPLAVYARGRLSITLSASTTDDDEAVVDGLVAVLPHVRA